MNAPQIAWLPDGRRLHMNHGPIDLILEAWGEADECRAAYGQAAARFETILRELVEELAELRRPSRREPRRFAGATALRMERAACRFAADGAVFVTPMAAVAGAVADEVLAAMTKGRELERAYVNDGGDIAIHLSQGESMRLAIGDTGDGFGDRISVDAQDPVRGIATSGWRGRSHSLGIADAVTVLARDGAIGDVAATLIANAVDLPGHPGVGRVPAAELSPDSDLGERLVTTAVGPLTAEEIDEALERGLALAEDFRRRGLIAAAALFLAGERRVSMGDGAGPALYGAPLCPVGHLPHEGGDRPSPPPRPKKDIPGRMHA
ncbi:UPF0280 family protein [Aquibium sp. LZ166]|uniref:UPF0280 family protein n=1 Tax=Aquibium pacificus TaxID=3153579 RepID=A0ABV3SM98_9HYPH